MIDIIFFIGDKSEAGKKMQVKNDSAKLFFSFHFWVFEVRRFCNPTNKISMALVSGNFNKYVVFR
jgi:hypothetical protein